MSLARIKTYFSRSTPAAVFTALLLVVAPLSHAEEPDPYLWLEGIDDPKALKWVERANANTDESLASDPLFTEIFTDALDALNRADKLPDIDVMGNWVYTLKKTEKNPRGRYVRASLKSFKSGKPRWRTVLDIDALSEKENVNWVFDEMKCLSPNYVRCLMFLSPGGGDASEMREFDANKLSFIKGGFQLPTAKMSVNWRDADHLFVSTDFGEGSQTDSGYPRITKIWERGRSLEDAKPVLEVGLSSVSASGTRLKSDSGYVDLLIDSLDFWNRTYYQWEGNKKRRLQLPASARVQDKIDEYLVVSLLDDWEVGGTIYKQGSIVLVEPETIWEGRAEPNIKLLRESTRESIIEDVMVSKHRILVTVLQDVKSRIYSYEKIARAWLAEPVALPDSGQLVVAATNGETGEFFARYEGFLTPPTLYSVDTALNARPVLQQSATFDASKMKVEQFFAESQDGTKVPYFVVMKKNLKLDGTNPTHIFSYGGFRNALTPSYSGSYEAHNGAYGKAWLERGGVFVLANIRGGSEYGPAWHAAALLENRHKAFEDFEAVAEDLIERKITAPKHLGVEGRSNGGLLVLATMVRRPDLYGAVICGVPLADMKRYNKMLAGASWMAEYGNPDTDDWQFIKTYSPYHNLDAGVDYPPIFFFGSTRDDRVHPGHARKMAAKMKSQGQKVEYFENTEGGHKGSVTAVQTARRIAFSFTHLWRELE